MLVEGPLTNLQTSHVALPNPDHKFDRRYFLLGSTLSTRYRPTDTVVYPTADPNVVNSSGAVGSTAAGMGRPMGGEPPSLHQPPQAPPPYGAPMGYGMGMMAPPPMHARPPPPLMHDNPYAIGPLMGPPGVLTQEALSLDQLSQRGMSLAALGQMSLGGMGMGVGIGGGMSGIDPRSRMPTGGAMGRG